LSSWSDATGRFRHLSRYDYRSGARQAGDHLRIGVASSGCCGIEDAAVVPSGARVWIAMCQTDMPKGMQGLALIV
jgi:hypothetical protein